MQLCYSDFIKQPIKYFTVEQGISRISCESEKSGRSYAALALNNGF